MPSSRGTHEGLAYPVDILSEEELAERKTHLGPAWPVRIIGGLPDPGPGGSGDLTYVHNQSVPSATWSITHNLGKFPSVTVVDSAGTVVVGDVKQLNSNQVQITFSAAFAGKAYLN